MPVPFIQLQTLSILENITITEENISDVLQCLDVSKAYGHDSVSPKLLKEALNEITYPLCKPV